MSRQAKSQPVKPRVTLRLDSPRASELKKEDILFAKSIVANESYHYLKEEILRSRAICSPNQSTEHQSHLAAGYIWGVEDTFRILQEIARKSGDEDAGPANIEYIKD